VYGTFLGSAAQTALATNYSNVATGLAADASGNAYVGGYANTCGYPVTVGAYQTANIERRLAVRAASSPRLHRTARASFGPHCWAASREDEQ